MSEITSHEADALRRERERLERELLALVERFERQTGYVVADLEVRTERRRDGTQRIAHIGTVVPT